MNVLDEDSSSDVEIVNPGLLRSSYFQQQLRLIYEMKEVRNKIPKDWELFKVFVENTIEWHPPVHLMHSVWKKMCLAENQVNGNNLPQQVIELSDDDESDDCLLIPDKSDDCLLIPDKSDDCLLIPDKSDDCLLISDKSDNCLLIPDKSVDCLLIPDKSDDCLLIPDKSDDCLLIPDKSDDCLLIPDKVVTPTGSVLLPMGSERTLGEPTALMEPLLQKEGGQRKRKSARAAKVATLPSEVIDLSTEAGCARLSIEPNNENATQVKTAPKPRAKRKSQPPISEAEADAMRERLLIDKLIELELPKVLQSLMEDAGLNVSDVNIPVIFPKRRSTAKRKKNSNNTM